MASEWMSLLLVLSGALLGLSLGMLVHRVLRLLEGAVRRTTTTFDDALLKSIQPGLPVLLMAVGLYVAVALPVTTVSTLGVRVAYALALMLGTWGLANIVVKFSRTAIRRRVERQPNARVLATLAPAIGFVVYTLGGLVVLGSLGIQITPILASLGIGGLAVAWALQDTLSNVFAGWWIRASREIRPGHYVRMDDEKLEGHVTSIGWRTTRIRTLGNNSIIVPNGVLGQAIVTNFNLPDPRLGASILVRVPYDEDPDRVAAILLEEAKAAQGEVKGMLKDPPAAVALNPGFGENGFEFTVGFQVDEYPHQVPVMDHLRRAIAVRFWKERIRFSVPTQQPILIEDRRAHWTPRSRDGTPRDTRPPRPTRSDASEPPEAPVPLGGRDLPHQGIPGSSGHAPSDGGDGPRRGTP